MPDGTTIFDDVAADGGQPSGGTIFDELASPSPVDQALASVPRPQVDVTETPPHGLYESTSQVARRAPLTPPAPPTPPPGVADYLAGAANVITGPGPTPGATPEVGTGFLHGARRTMIPGQRLGGTAEMINAAGEAV